MLLELEIVTTAYRSKQSKSDDPDRSVGKLKTIFWKNIGM
jgi:hypothetical protein